MLEHIADAIIDELDAALGEAIRRVGEHREQQATVSLAFTVGRDKDERLTVTYQAKDGTKRGGEWRPSLAPRLPFDVPDGVDEVTISGAGRSVTLRGRAATGI